jgi:hypothetical protein
VRVRVRVRVSVSVSVSVSVTVRVWDGLAYVDGDHGDDEGAEDDGGVDEVEEVA